MNAPLGYLDYRCSKCGGDSCGNDATAQWDAVTQTQVLGGTFDNEWCNECGDVSSVEFTITDPVRIAAIDAAREELRLASHAPEMAAIMRELGYGETSSTRMNEIMARAREIVGPIEPAAATPDCWACAGTGVVVLKGSDQHQTCPACDGDCRTDEPCPIHRQPQSRCPATCNHGE